MADIMLKTLIQCMVAYNLSYETTKKKNIIKIKSTKTNETHSKLIKG